MPDQRQMSMNDTIEIIVPARPEFAATLRLIAASLGADAGFDVDEIDDVRLALNEAFTAAAEATGDDGRVSVSFATGADGIEVVVFVIGEGLMELDPLGETVLRSVVDDLRQSGGTLRFVKRAAVAPA